MKYHMDRTLRFWVEVEYDRSKTGLANLRRSEIIGGILIDYERKGHANRYVRRDGEIGWRATDKFREDLFEQEQDALDDD
jgi:hypothetical protein